MYAEARGTPVPTVARLFVALVPRDVDAVEAAIAPMRPAPPGFRWTRPEHIHLTVRFLGDTPVHRIDALVTALRAVAMAAEPVVLGVAGGGAFPSARRARVLWLGVTPNDAPASRYHAVDSACGALGLGRERRAFRPQLTVARPRGRTPAPPEAVARAIAAAGPPLHTDVLTLDIFASELGAAGARHRRITPLPLGAALGTRQRDAGAR